MATENYLEVVRAVQNGARTAKEATEATGRNVPTGMAHVNRMLKAATEDGLLAREKDGRSYVYAVTDDGAEFAENGASQSLQSAATATPASAPTPTPAATDDNGVMPVSRDYDWDEHIPSVARDYVSANGEWDELNALIDAREAIGRHPRFLIGGPTGCGKTTLAETVAAQRGWPLFTLQMRYSVREKDLVGSPSIANGTSTWTDGTLTKALLASKERPVVLLVDEANRARPESKSILFSALDHRARIVLDGPRGGEPIDGNPMNLIVIATVNEGAEYFGTQKMDMAEKRRFGARYDVDYLGINHEEREADLIVEAADVPYSFAKKVVEAANAVRNQAKDNASSVNAGVPTSAAISWAQAARAFEDAGVKNPVMAAAMAEVVRPFYDGQVADNVMSTIETHLDNAPVANFDAWDDDTEVACGACGFRQPLIEAENDGVAASMKCPECDGDLRMVESGN